MKTSVHLQAMVMTRSIFALTLSVGILLTHPVLTGCSPKPKPKSAEVAKDLSVETDGGSAVPVDASAVPEDEDKKSQMGEGIGTEAGTTPPAAPIDPRLPGPEPDEPAVMPPGSLQETLDDPTPVRSGEEVLEDGGYVSPSDRVREALDAPPAAVRISKSSPLFIDVSGKRLFVDGYVAQRQAYLEMFACDAETKEHESVLGVVAKSSEVHAALLAIGATVGRTVRYDPEYSPATGQSIRIWVMWYDEEGNFRSADARQWVRHSATKSPLDRDWVFAGSSLWKDPSDGKEYYQADSGEMVCLSNFSTALLDLPIESTDANSDLQFEAFTENIPPTGTVVRLMMVPLPMEDAQGENANGDTPQTVITEPDASLMPRIRSAPAP
jgi:hypothetical protein